MDSKLKEVALELTKADISRYRQYLIILQERHVPADAKYDAAMFVKKMSAALARLKKETAEQQFTIFYNYYFNGQRREVIAESVKVDASTITRNSKRTLRKLANIVYFDLMNADLIYP